MKASVHCSPQVELKQKKLLSRILIKFFRPTCTLFISLLNILHKKPVVGDDCSAQGARNKRFECSGRATARAETCEFIFYRLLHTASIIYKGVKLTLRDLKPAPSIQAEAIGSVQVQATVSFL